MYYENNRDRLIEIFNDTISLCQNNDKLKSSIKESINGQKIILESDKIDIAQGGRTYENDLKLTVSKSRSFEAAQKYNGKKVCVLNFASATNPGGGVERGASAQEECLCRCSTLYPCISEGKTRNIFHNSHKSMLHNGTMSVLYNDDCIYTPDVLIFKSDTKHPELMPQDQWFTADIITCAAPNLRSRPSNYANPDSGYETINIDDEALKTLHIKRANRILDIAKANRAEVVILGAFGCGAFRNPPDIVAEGMYESVKQHIHDFEIIEFAVYCSPKDSINYDTFYKHLIKNR